MKNKIWGIILVASLVVIAISGINIFKLSSEYRKGINEYKALEQYATVEAADVLPEKVITDTEGEVTEEKESQIPVSILLNHTYLRSVNEDFKGWLYYEPLELSYPVVRGNDNDHYTHYTFENEKNSSGAIFMDFLNKPDFSDYNTIIYGHNMRNGTMFGSLKKLLNDEELIKEDPYFYVFTEEKSYMYEIFAVYITKASSHTYDLIDSPEAQEEYLAYIEDTATWHSGKEITGEDKIVTLSTCHGVQSNNRTVVHGVLVVEEDR